MAGAADCMIGEFKYRLGDSSPALNYGWTAMHYGLKWEFPMTKATDSSFVQSQRQADACRWAVQMDCQFQVVVQGDREID